MTTGLVVGKFLPLHLGHELLVDTAIAGCDHLVLVVSGRTDEEGIIPLAVREAWLRDRWGPDPRVTIVADLCDAPTSNSDPVIVDFWARRLEGLAGGHVDRLFSSEALTYGPATAAAMGAEHVDVDSARRLVPISGTACRADPLGSWAYLSLPVRAWYAVRVRVLGGESTGTTTLADLLARRLVTAWVAEWGRAYSDPKDAAGESWATADFVAIATEQGRLEDVAARRCSGVLVCDTDPLTTGVWHAEYLGGRAPEVEAIGAARPYALTLLTDTDIPWVQDGNRSSAANRERQQRALLDRLAATGTVPIVLSGSRDRRVELALAALEPLGVRPPAAGVGLMGDGLAGRWGFVRPDGSIAGSAWTAPALWSALNDRRTTWADVAAETGLSPEAVREADWWSARHVELATAILRGDAAAIARLRSR